MDQADQATKPKRPARTFTTGPWARSLRIAATVGFVAISGYVLLRYPTLPETVATHFDVRGQADGFGHRSSVLWLGGVMLAMGVGIAWLSTKPHVFNYPGVVTQENAQRVYREGERLMVGMLMALLVTYLGVVQSIIEGSGSALIVMGLIGLAASTMTGLIRVSIAETPTAR